VTCRDAKQIAVNLFVCSAEAFKFLFMLVRPINGMAMNFVIIAIGVSRRIKGHQ
jgi:hypothetical protein